ncbi:MAG: 4Fe-4S binding protein [Candidatus Lokiarchaeota archaeon]|nr:4Fe-4S binding protein [Candidatus Lokiarchaeota archaeon]MBD3198725.1 4Fe-4S binding protein [Candidatus Lokiarchaeota archaeon]
MNLKNLKLREKSTNIIRRIVQISAFLLINYIILEFIFSINLISLEGFFKVFPVLNSPRNPLSEGAGILEYIFYSITQGLFPILLIGAFILIILLTNRFFCGWICPIGTIQDGITALPIDTKSMKMTTHKTLLKVKYIIIALLVILIIPLGITRVTDLALYVEFRDNLGPLAQKPIGFFSLSEFIFVFFPNMIASIWTSGGLAPLFSDIGLLAMFAIYIIIIVLSVWYPRFYCRYICPFGAVASTISTFSFLKLSRSPVKCVGRQECGICERVCPKQIRILDEPYQFFTGNGECNMCLECKEKCPYAAINIKFG